MTTFVRPSTRASPRVDSFAAAAKAASMRIGRALCCVVATMVACLVLAGPGPATAEEPQQPGREPGLPFVPCKDMLNNACPSPDFADTYMWLNFMQLGMAGSTKAKQWARIPVAVTGNVAHLGYGYPEPNPPEYTGANDFYYELRSFFVSPKGSKDNYGLSPIIPVRTVAFGSIPVQVELQIGQRRDANGLPIPLESTAKDDVRRDYGGVPNRTRTRLYPAKLDQKVHVFVRSIRVDGVPVTLDRTCQTSTLARVDITSKYVEHTGTGNYQYEEFDPREGFYGLTGGTLKGSIDIPSFGGCSTSTGDDISPLLTATVSGEGNPVDIVVGEMSCTQYTDDGRARPPSPGSSTAESIGCKRATPNPKVKPVPDELPFPDSAPARVP